MLARTVAGPNRYRDASLGPRAGTVGQGFFGHENYRKALRGEPPRRPQSGYSGAYYDGTGWGHMQIYSGAAGQRGRHGVTEIQVALKRGQVRSCSLLLYLAWTIVQKPYQ
jgi:hypothetical protein